MVQSTQSDKSESRGSMTAKVVPADVGRRTAPGIGPQSLIAGIAVVTALYFGRDVFVPIALAVLLTFLLAPLVSMLRRLRVPRAPAVILVVALAMCTIALFATVVVNQLGLLASNLPSYQYNIENKIRDFKEWQVATGTFDRAAGMIEELEAEIQEAQEGGDEDEPEGQGARPSLFGAGQADGEEPAEPPTRVIIDSPDRDSAEMLRMLISTIVAPLATGGIVIVFVIFMLLRREDLRDRFIRLVGASDMHRTTNALQDAGRRVAQYLFMQLIVNVTYAVPVAIGLWAIGVPNALLWGLLALVLRFVPYVGPIIAAFFPLALSIAVDPGWSTLIWTAALLLTLELISNNFIEPWLYGSRTGLSPVAIIIAAIFWTWLWGPIGLLLSTPLTVCFVVLGRHVPQFEFLDILLGNQPVLSPHERLYQRLLAGDPDEATEQAEHYLRDHPVRNLYDHVAIPALVLVENDRSRGVLADHQREIVASGAIELVENLADHRDLIAEAEEIAERSTDPRRDPELDIDFGKGDFVCAGARGNLDDAAAFMLSDAIRRAGKPARCVPHDMMQSAQIKNFDFSSVGTIVVGYLNSESVAHARYLVRRLRRASPQMNVVIAFWGLAMPEHERAILKSEIAADALVSTIEELSVEVASWTETSTGREHAPEREGKATDRDQNDEDRSVTAQGRPAPA